MTFFHIGPLVAVAAALHLVGDVAARDEPVNDISSSLSETSQIARVSLRSANSKDVGASTRDRDEMLERFRRFRRSFNKTYHSAAEVQARFEAFSANVHYIERQNRRGTNTFELGITEMSDMTQEEFHSSYLAAFDDETMRDNDEYSNGPLEDFFYDLSPGNVTTNVTTTTQSPLPQYWDWRQYGAVTNVKNQAKEKCKSGWAFSTTGALEGAWKLRTGILLQFSEQQLIDCARTFGEEGCEGGGGGMNAAFNYVRQFGLETEANYTYQGTAGICYAEQAPYGLPIGRVKSYKDVVHNDEQALMEAVLKQPVAAAIQADSMTFQNYRKGIISGDCGDSTKPNHAVLIVGFGREPVTNGKRKRSCHAISPDVTDDWCTSNCNHSPPLCPVLLCSCDGPDHINYWLIKNSWGQSWGEGGFGKILRGNDTWNPDMCGITRMPSYPIIEDPSPAPTPGPPTPPPTPGPIGPTHHYEKPPCQKGEWPAEVKDTRGITCAPGPCSEDQDCTTDVPEGTTAQPHCIVQDPSSGQRYCALTCFLDDICPPRGTCRHDGLVGICMYDEDHYNYDNIKHLEINVIRKEDLDMVVNV